MERKIGEIFEYNGEWYQCVEGETICSECDLRNIICQRDTSINNPFKECSGNYRTDKKNIIFKKLEKVGEPYEFDGHLFQSYRTFEVPIFTENYATVREYGNNSKISIEIKQNKEDMEDLDKIKVRDYTKVEELNVMEEKKLNLKPFDIQKAREGKPVCTRDGRKARIICFDRISGDDYYKIVACVTAFDGDFEEVLFYGIDGYIVDSQNPKDEDLMMLPEKKEGWVNVYREESNNNERLIEQTIYKTRKDAFEHDCPQGYITTTKINWEE